jgi:hypothetical protein
MTTVRLPSDTRALPADARLRARGVLGRAAAMGLVDPPAVEQADANDEQLWEALQTVAARARDSGIGVQAGSYLRSTSLGDPWDVELVRNIVEQLGDALEGSPLPNREIPELVRVLGWPLLERLSGGVEVSLRRYANEKRVAPDDLADRIHVLALMVGDLRGGYNDFGVRRWLQRPRTQLGGRRPLDILQGDWSPQAADVQSVRDLAAWVAEPTPAS